MTAFVYETGNEKAISGALALVMHLLFVLLLVFGVSWQQRNTDTMVAELWSNLPAPPAPKVEPPPPPPPQVQPEPPKPVPRAEPRPVPKVEPKSQPKAEIDLREKQEKARKAKEQAALERRKREEEALAEKKRKEEQARLEAVRQQQAKEAEARRLAREQEEALKKLAQQEQAARAREVDKYKRAIEEKIRRFIVRPPHIQGNPVAELDIVILPGGEVLDVRTTKASGQSPWDNACERAIRRAQPLPIPPADSPIFSEFRELKHACRY